MNAETSKKVFSVSQECIKQLNSMLIEIKQDVSEEEFTSLKRSIGLVMGTLVEICENYVYNEYPEFRPY